MHEQPKPRPDRVGPTDGRVDDEVQHPLGEALRAAVPAQDLSAKVWRERAARALFGQQQWPTVGRYRIEGRLGSGGFGEVFEAFDPTLERSVAIKMLRRGTGERLVEEGRKLARISHPHVVSVFEVGEHEGQVYLVMELLRGGSLLRRDALPSSLEARLDLMIQACNGVSAAHEAGVMHGDFKPANVLLDDAGRAKVADFGLARLEDEVSRPGGTHQFMAPEQASQGPSRAADQFAICRSIEAVMGPSMPARLRQIVVRGTAEDPDNRFASVAELERALLRVRHRRTRRRFAALAGAAALSMAAAAVVAVDRDTACTAPSQGGAKVWSTEAQTQVRRAFASVEYGDEAWKRLDQRLETYESAVDDGWLESCEMEGVARERAQRCLAGRLDDMQSLVDALRVPSEQAIERAVVAAAALEPPRECLDPSLASSPAPSHPNLLGRTVENRMRSADVALRLGEWDAAVSDAEQGSLIAYRSGDTRLIARSLLILGMAEARRDGATKSDRSLRSAFELAGSIGATSLAREAALELARAHTRSASFDEARRWMDRLVALDGEQTATQRGEQLALQAMLLDVEGDHVGSKRAANQAVELLAGADRPEALGRVINHLGELSFDNGAYAESRRHYEGALTVLESALGPSHPWIAGTHGNLGELSLMLNDPAAAEEHFSTAHAIRERAYGTGAFWTVHTMAHLADAALARDDLDLAEQRYETVIERVERFEPEAGTLLAWAEFDAGVDSLDDWAHAGLALIALRRGEPETARPHAEVVGEDGLRNDNRHVDHASRLDLLARTQLELGDLDTAYDAAHWAWRVVYAEYGPRHFKSAFVSETLGLVLAQTGRCEAAAAHLRAAEEIWDQDPGMIPRERAVLQIATLCPSPEKKRR